ncbi:MAG: Gfo/Idh/MocA family oxidoreductase [Planctomycetota bacterium]
MPDVNRREFLHTTTTAATAAALGLTASGRAHSARPGADQEIRIGLVGCGGRGTGAAAQAIQSSEGVRLVAMGDVFADKVTQARDNLEKTDAAAAVQVDDRSCFAGLDAYRRVIEHADVNHVILATPPGFRPQQLEAVVAAGKHCFMEKPACVDPVGYRAVIAAAKRAREQGTAIGTGTQFRRANHYADVIAAIHDGAIGDVLFAQARYCSGGIWYRERQEGMADAEYQIHNWYHFVWLCGDQIVEQAVHNLDAINWAMGGPPARAYGSGGQRCRPADSEIYDCTSLDYEYPNGASLSFQCRQQPGKGQVWNRIVGVKGEAWIHPFSFGEIKSHGGEKVLKVRYRPNAYVDEHRDLIASIRAGTPIVEAEEMADSTLTAVLGRLAAYTGEEVEWDFVQRESKLDLMPPELRLDAALPAPAVAVPGQTALV